MPSRKEPLPIGHLTPWGLIAAVGVTGGERYYWMIDGNDTAMMPADVVEALPAEGPEAASAQGSKSKSPSQKGPQ